MAPSFLGAKIAPFGRYTKIAGQVDRVTIRYCPGVERSNFRAAEIGYLSRLALKGFFGSLITLS